MDFRSVCSELIPLFLSKHNFISNIYKLDTSFVRRLEVVVRFAQTVGNHYHTFLIGKLFTSFFVFWSSFSALHWMFLFSTYPSHVYFQVCNVDWPLAAPPEFSKRPADQKVGLNGIARFECEAQGNPPPSVFWSKEGSQVLMFPGNSYGTMTVAPEGSLTITGVQREDAGFLVCSALSVAGSTTARAYLQVCDHILLQWFIVFNCISCRQH